MVKRLKRLSFLDRTSQPKHGLVMICDLEGFSRFFNQPDVSDYVSKFLNHVFEALTLVFKGGTTYWVDKGPNLEPLDLQPSHIKFLGDGAMFIWTPAAKDQTFSDDFLELLCNRLWTLKTHFPKLLAKCADDVPVFDLPERIRFGLARGTIYEMRYEKSNEREYIGFCINLASRLQNYCSELGFIASARLGLSSKLILDNGYMKVIATKIKGFSNEIVIVDRSEFDRLDEEVRKELFDLLPHTPEIAK